MSLEQAPGRFCSASGRAIPICRLSGHPLKGKELCAYVSFHKYLIAAWFSSNEIHFKSKT